jgi:hypothetical protein
MRKGSLLAPAPKGPLLFSSKAVATMWHNLVRIGGIWLVAVVFAWLICRWRGHNAAAWAFTITAFCTPLDRRQRQSRVPYAPQRSRVVTSPVQR